MKVTDYIIEFIASKNVNTVFGVTGGAVLHLFDSAEKHPCVKTVYNHHEQASALAAVAYARVTKGIGVAFVTTGPGGTNAITGVAAAWLDSVPCIFISGQTRLAHSSHKKPLRQIGSQEIDIISIVESVTKYSCIISSIDNIKYEMEKAYYYANEGRPGPVWIDLPLDFQWQEIDPENQHSYIPEIKDSKNIPVSYHESIELLEKAERPLLVIGRGCNSEQAQKSILIISEKYHIPFVLSWGIADFVPSDHPLNMGRIGLNGQRGGNLTVQNCDLLLALGSHLCITMTGTLTDAFAREATKIMVDIDINELQYSNVTIDLPIHTDVGDYLTWLESQDISISNWSDRAAIYKHYNKVEIDHVVKNNQINPYLFIRELASNSKEGDCFVIDGGGTNVYASMQSLNFKKYQTLVFSSGICAMGSGLPESIGASFGNVGKVICLVGDGSFQFNIQELQTIFHHQLDIKIFIFNNDGYLAIRNTQDSFFNNNYFGSDKSGGLSLPEYEKIVKAYKLQYFKVDTIEKQSSIVQEVLNTKGPVVCEVFIPRNTEIAPVLGFEKDEKGVMLPRPLEDMSPYLPRNELEDLMIINKWRS